MIPYKAEVVPKPVSDFDERCEGSVYIDMRCPSHMVGASQRSEAKATLLET